MPAAWLVAAVMALAAGVVVVSPPPASAHAHALALVNSDSHVHTDSRGAAPKKLRLAATTAVVADLVRQVAGEDAAITQLVPNGADPHSWEPTLRDTREVAHADAVFSNHLLLEEQSLIRTIDANIARPERHIHLAEEAKKYGAHLIQLVEDPSLNTVWLGMRVRAQGERAAGPARAAQEARIRVDGIRGPGTMAAYLTGTFGQPQIYLTNAPGEKVANSVALPLNAHTHMSWAFTKPGVYHMRVSAELAPSPGAPQTRTLPPKDVTFAVGIDPAQAGVAHTTVIDAGHMDLSANWDAGRIEFYGDRVDGKQGEDAYDPAKTVVAVPNVALAEIPANPAYRFLGSAGDKAYILAQAVLGKHVHGEIDPHVWQSVGNAKAMVQVVRDTLVALDPASSSAYRKRARDYLARLDRLDDYVRQVIGAIPPSHRHLVTTHDAYGYLGWDYGLQITGFVTPNPGIEPSTTDIVRLSRTLRDLQVPAVFIEPVLATHARDLVQAATASSRRVCTLYGDTFTDQVGSYVAMMAANAYNLKVCLDPEGGAPARFSDVEAGPDPAAAAIASHPLGGSTQKGQL